MPKKISATPENIHKVIKKIRPGDTLQLLGGLYKKPIVLAGLMGTRKNKIIIEGFDQEQNKAVVGSKIKFDIYNNRANKFAAIQLSRGRYPGLNYIANQAHLTLTNCQWVVIKNLHFKRCWPTAIYIDNCQWLTFDKLDFREGVFAICASGRSTHHLTIQNCFWQQDTSNKHKLWNKIGFKRVHDNSKVDIEKDFRAFDGDFFRSWNIQGYVRFIGNKICDAFNGMHFYYSRPGNPFFKDHTPVDEFNRNILFENNVFIRIRDNLIEPETYAWNWVIRHNTFIDCYSPFSLQLRRSGNFYIYGNLGWSSSRPKPNDGHTRGRIFKLPRRRKPDDPHHQADGPHYFVHNSWSFRSPIVPWSRFSNFIHMNNAIDYDDELNRFDDNTSGPFGREWYLPHRPDASLEEITNLENRHFTKLWDKLGIRFDSDIIHHPDFPNEFRGAGFPIGMLSRGVDPGFTNSRKLLDMYDSKRGGQYLKLKPDSPARSKAGEMSIILPYGKEKKVYAGGDIGAWQNNNKDLFEFEFPYLNYLFADFESKHFGPVETLCTS